MNHLDNASSGVPSLTDTSVDLEMTKRCAEAMGFSSLVAIPTVDSTGMAFSPPQYAYCPLHNDAQAMALVKRFRLWLKNSCTGCQSCGWDVGDDEELYRHVHSEDLNRAIVECVANMMRATPSLSVGSQEKMDNETP